jgi:hypothetical protein
MSFSARRALASRSSFMISASSCSSFIAMSHTPYCCCWAARHSLA